MLVNERIRPGTVLEIETKEEKGGRICTVRRQAEVVRQYPHHILVKLKNGSRMCVTNAELLHDGIVTQDYRRRK